MKHQKAVLFLIYSFLIMCLAAILGFAIYSFIKGEYAAGGVLTAFFAFGAIGGVGTIVQKKFVQKCIALFLAQKYAEEREFIEKKMRSPFYFLIRIAAMQHYSYACGALDDLKTSKRYIERLRVGGGKGWKYRTAYLYILILLDENRVPQARAEYEDFKRDCAQAEVYKEQMEVLVAIFQRLFSFKNAAPLPPSAIESNYPVVARILGRQYEEGFEDSQ